MRHNLRNLQRLLWFNEIPKNNHFHITKYLYYSSSPVPHSSSCLLLVHSLNGLNGLDGLDVSHLNDEKYTPILIPFMFLIVPTDIDWCRASSFYPSHKSSNLSSFQVRCVLITINKAKDIIISVVDSILLWGQCISAE